ncbi:MAG TPA: nucleotide sugar dehydrogenase [Alphaproteobacteria bacterium]|nr:nucleotide sugar dehydrogenase [Alphaproteobacteria bacterium]
MSAVPPVVGYAGMTHLGLNSAVAAAERGFAVVCFDPGRDCIAALARGEPTVSEPDLAELMAKNAERLSFTSEASALRRCAVVYISPDVPTDDGGTSDLGPLTALIAAVEPVLAAEASMVVLSQVPPGFTRGLARAEGQRFYQVETLIFGRAIERALHPERFILGCADPAQPLPPALASFLGSFGCPILRMRYESAELCKIAINFFLVASVSAANSLAELCERIGADWSEIMPALRLDKRIGEHAYIAPGLGIAGGNLERDLATFVRMGAETGAETGVVLAWQANSRHRRFWALRRLHETVLARQSDPLIGVLGLAYKENTHSTKNSPALALIAELRPFRLRAFDPAVKVDPDWHPALAQASDPLDACKDADAVVIMTPWQAFKALEPAAIAKAMAGRVVIDPFGALDGKAAASAGLEHHRLGAPRR